MNEPEPIQSEFLIQENIRHGFHTRLGGVSKGIYQGLNVGLGSDDNREDVLENRRRVANYQGVTADHLMTVYQVHSSDIITINNPLEDAEGQKRMVWFLLRLEWHWRDECRLWAGSVCGRKKSGCWCMPLWMERSNRRRARKYYLCNAAPRCRT